MFTIPETHGPTVLRHKAQRIRKAKIPGYENVKSPIEQSGQTLVALYKVALTRPWVILFDTISFLCAIYMAVVYTLLYMLFSIYPSEYIPPVSLRMTILTSISCVPGEARLELRRRRITIDWHCDWSYTWWSHRTRRHPSPDEQDQEGRKEDGGL